MRDFWMKIIKEFFIKQIYSEGENSLQFCCIVLWKPVNYFRKKNLQREIEFNFKQIASQSFLSKKNFQIFFPRFFYVLYDRQTMRSLLSKKKAPKIFSISKKCFILLFFIWAKIYFYPSKIFVLQISFTQIKPQLRSFF